MKTLKIVLPIVVVLVVLCIIAALAAYLYYNSQQSQAFEDRPLVLIHAPLNREHVFLNEAILTHATARAQNGVARVELWVDGEFYVARESSGQGAVSPLVLTAGWQPAVLGSHVLLVRAFSTSGVEGQATVAVEVVEAPAKEETGVGGYIVQKEDETLETIAEKVGTTKEELEALNPGLGGEDPAPGDLVRYPEDEDGTGGGEDEDAAGGSPPSGADPPPAGDPPPDPHGEAPRGEGGLFDGGEIPGFSPADPLDEVPVSLRLEVLALETGSAYESLHCYASLAEGDPRWYPDVDFDQTTDESFASSDGRNWDVAAHLSGEQALVVAWPGDQMLPIDVTCVGVTGGGTDGVPLGRSFVTVRPEAWDGVTRRAVSGDGEGTFTMDYRVSRTEEGGSRGYPIFLDPTMSPPTNLRMGFWTLHWDYEPRADEEPIHGFRVYLNGTLQWAELPDARYSTLPYEWLNPPCGVSYEFTVTAFRYGYPDGPESPPSNVVLVPGGEHGSGDCDRTLVVRLDTLSTEYLERDMGPIHGNFYVNDRVIGFDGRCHGSGICGEVGMYADWEYDINMLTTMLGSDGPPRFVVDVPPGEQLVIGYDIYAEGEGRVCAGETWYEGRDLDRVHSGGIVSERPSGYSSRCRVSYTVNPAFGSPTGEAGGPLPLPLLMVEDLTVKESTGQLQIHIRNVGAASWPGKDLDVAVTWPDGSGIGGYTWPELILQPGEHAILEHPDLVPEPHPPLGACVLLDPGNRVPEEDDQSLGWTRGRYCRPLPDLTVTDAVYDDVNERLLVTVENIGEGSVEHRNLGLQINLADGRYFAAPAEWWSDVSIEPRGVILMEWAHIGPDQRALMLDGYTAVIDPNNDIAEESGFNNEYTVRTSTRLWLSWTWINVPYDFRNMSEFSFTAYAVSGGAQRTVADWHIGQDIDWGSCFRPYHCMKHYDNEEYDTYWFDIAGDEDLVIDIVVSHPGTLHDSVRLTQVYGPEENWGAGGLGPRRTCGYFGGERQPNSYTWVFGYSEGYAWDTTFHICREDAE